ncbi:MAG: polymerase [Porticoccaceae bacterium]|nr:MAG: polymerase [Porticoccaceae bacterium]
MALSSTAARWEGAIFTVLCAALVWAPLPFASARPWATALLFLPLAAAAGAWLALAAAGKAALPVRVWRRSALPLLLLTAVCGWVFAQTLPLPRPLLAWLSPEAARWHLVDPAPLSLDVAATRLYLLRALSCLAAFFLVVATVRGEGRARVLLGLVVASGLFQAVYGTTMVLSGLEWGFFVEKYVGRGSATGTFVNPNHLAGYLVLALAAGTGLLVAELGGPTAATWRQRLANLVRLALSAKTLLRGSLALMVIALVLSRSRMGNLAFFAALGTAAAAALVARRRFSPRLVLLVASILVVDLWIVGEWFGFDRVVERLRQTQPAAEARLAVSSETTRILRDFALTGAGGGAFAAVFPRYQGADLAEHFDHAHNDYLEFAVDLGLPATLALGGVGLLALRRAWLLLGADHSRFQRGVGFALVMAFTWAALHSAVDFNLQIPANAVTFAALLGLAFADLLPRERSGGRMLAKSQS